MLKRLGTFFTLKKTSFACGVLCALVLIPSIIYGQIPFGGPIIVPTICDEGMHITIGPPTPMPLMWVPGTVSFAFGPPSHTGQFLLGMTGGFMICTDFGVPINGGLLILFHGSSE